MKVEDYIASGILEQFVLGELSAEDAAEVMDMAARYPQVREEIALIEDTLQGMAESLAVRPSDKVFNAIKAKIEKPEEAQEPEAVSRKNKKIHYLQYGVAASFTLKVVAMLIAGHFWLNWKQTETALSGLQQRYNQLEQQARQTSERMMAVAGSGFQTVILQNNEAGNEQQVVIYWNPETLELYVSPHQLPANSESQQYQLWGIAGDKTVSLGMFDVSNTALLPAMVPMEGVQGLSSFAITLEPKGGSPSPSTEPQYSQRLAQ